MKKFLITLLTLCSIFAICLFAACGDNNSNNPGTDPGTNPGGDNPGTDPGGDTDPTETSVTYTFVIGEEKVPFTVKQNVDSELTYTYNLVNYTDEWFSDEACTVSVSTATGASMTVYTNATDINVRVVFRTESGTTNGQYAKRNGVTLPAGTEKVGYDFAGWSYGGKVYGAEEKFSLEDVTASLVEFVATYNVQSYTITYKSEGQEDQVLTQEYGSDVAAAPVRKGYVFTGWSDGKNIITKIEGAATLTATWQKKTYSVIVNDAEAKQYEWGDVITLNEVSRPGYTFIGWQKSVDGGALVDIDGTSYTVGNDADYEAESIVLSPKYEALSLGVHIVNGVGEYAEISVGENLYENLKAFEPKNFSGWFYDATFTKALGRKDVMTSESITLYASTGKTYTVTFVNGAETTEKTFNFNTEFTAADSVAKEGYTFTGWYTEREDGEKVEGVWAEDITVYAQFTVNSYTVTFDPSTGTGSRDAIIGEYGSQITLPDGTGMSKEYATFAGWTDGDTNYSVGDEYTIVGDVTLYAVWDVVTVSVTLYDWDDYVIWSGDVEAGKAFDDAHSVLEFWYAINEFENFTYSDSLNTKTYTLNDGDYLTDEVPVIEAHAVYMNRYTNTVLELPRLSNLVFQLRTDKGHTDEYFVSGKKGTFSTDPTKSNLEKMFVGSGFGTNLNLPATYQGKLVTAIPAAQEHYFGAFSIAFAAQPTGGVYDDTPYRILNSIYIPSCYQFIGTWSFASQYFTTIYIGQNSAITEFIDNNSLTGGGGAVVSSRGNGMKFYGFPKNLTKIGTYGFQGKSVAGDPDSFAVYDDQMNRITELPSSITYLGSNALKGTDIFEKVDLSNVTYIGTALFDGKETLKEVIIGNKITSIPDYCFRSCLEISSLHIPAQVTSIGSSAFQIYKGDQEKAKLTSLTFAPNSKLKTIGSHAFFLCPIQELIFPEGLETIGNYAFGANTNYEGSLDTGNKFTDWLLPLNKVYFPNSLKSIGDWAFSSTSISTLEWGSSIKTVGKYAFYDTPNLKQITIPDTLTEIAEGTFKKRYSYEFNESEYFTLTISKNIKTIGKNAFHNFKNILHVEFAEDCALTRIDGYAFANCLDVCGELKLPSKLEYIGGDMFAYLGTGNVASKDNLCASKITKLYIPATVTEIAFSAFQYSLELEEIEFADNQDPEATLYINGNAFAHCPKLTSVVFPCQLTKMNGASLLDRDPLTNEPYFSGAFAYCESLATITFRGRQGGNDSELHIASCVFEGCRNVTAVYIGRDTEIIVDNTNGSSIPEIGGTGASMLLRHSSGNFKLYVIQSMMNTYRNTLNRWCAAAGNGTKNVSVWKP